MASPRVAAFSFPRAPVAVHNHHLLLSSRVRASSSPSSSNATSPPPPPSPPDGVGPAALTRGDRFIGRQLAAEAAARVLAPEEAERRRLRKEKRRALARKPSGLASCYGCGAPLQTEEDGAPGYVDPATYELKKRHHQLRTILCGRCKLLSHGHMVTAVGGHGGYPGGKQFVSAEQLREKLSYLRHEKALIVKLVDIVDFNGSFLARVRDFAGANPIILVITKIDLLPRDTDLNCIGDWVVESVVKKKLNVLSVHLTSSKSLVGITGVISEIQQEKKGRDVYILKINKLHRLAARFDTLDAHIHNNAVLGFSKCWEICIYQCFTKLIVRNSAAVGTMAYKDPVAAAAQKYKPIQSAVPGTTLGPIQIDAFLGGGKLYDTPGVHLHHRQAAVIHADDLPSLAPQSRLKGRCYPSQVGVTLTPPTGKERAEGWMGLEGVRELRINMKTLMDLLVTLQYLDLGGLRLNRQEAHLQEDAILSYFLLYGLVTPVHWIRRGSTTTTMADAPISSGESPPPPQPAQPEGGSISSMVASAAAAAADFTRWVESFGAEKADAAKAALDAAATLATSSASAAASASSTAASSAYATASDLALIAKEDLEWAKKEYSVHEQMVFGKIKEGVVMAIMHPGIAAGSVTLAGIVLFKSNIVAKELPDPTSAAHVCKQRGLKSILDQLPRAHASEFRSEISGLASQVKKEKRLLNTALSKIVNYGVPI
ncbi:hypothetical protein PR202_ga06193 [Eleusine coracana subsp. coracana]|uniref:G domain-containing protein n=1 Tax=Eleusine coracana subsp. coracana TaxID=191504 RepID=A0AAV5BUS6_ELECO|nr:hypothetical protein PR202_ga06193 [Eleusine coracana subsp. coracana]